MDINRVDYIIARSLCQLAAFHHIPKLSFSTSKMFICISFCERLDIMQERNAENCFALSNIHTVRQLSHIKTANESVPIGIIEM